MTDLWLYSYLISFFGSVSFGYFLLRFGLPDIRILPKQIKLGLSGFAGILIFLISGLISFFILTPMYLYILMPSLTFVAIIAITAKNRFLSSNTINVALPIVKIQAKPQLIKRYKKEEGIIEIKTKEELRGIEEPIKVKRQEAEIPYYRLMIKEREKEQEEEEQVGDKIVVERKVRASSGIGGLLGKVKEKIKQQKPIEEIESPYEKISKSREEKLLKEQEEEEQVGDKIVVERKVRASSGIGGLLGKVNEKIKLNKTEEEIESLYEEKTKARKERQKKRLSVYEQRRREREEDSGEEQHGRDRYDTNFSMEEKQVKESSGEEKLSRRDSYLKRKEQFKEQAKADLTKSNEFKGPSEPLPIIPEEEVQLEFGEGLDLSDLESIGSLGELSELSDLEGGDSSLFELEGLDDFSLDNLGGLSELSEIPKEKGMSCPFCKAKNTSITYCPNCGKGFCTNCSLEINRKGELIFYKCPSCKKDVIVKA